MSLPGNFFSGSFFVGQFFGLRDTHDGVDDHSIKKHNKKRIEDREKLREQILFSIDGFPPELVEKLESFSTPQIQDSVYIPLSERIDFDSISEEVINEVTKFYEVGKSVRTYKRKEELEEARKKKVIEQDEEAVMVFMMLIH